MSERVVAHTLQEKISRPIYLFFLIRGRYFFMHREVFMTVTVDSRSICITVACLRIYTAFLSIAGEETCPQHKGRIGFIVGAEPRNGTVGCLNNVKGFLAAEITEPRRRIRFWW